MRGIFQMFNLVAWPMQTPSSALKAHRRNHPLRPLRPSRYRTAFSAIQIPDRFQRHPHRHHRPRPHPAPPAVHRQVGSFHYNGFRQSSLVAVQPGLPSSAGMSSACWPALNAALDSSTISSIMAPRCLRAKTSMSWGCGQITSMTTASFIPPWSSILHGRWTTEKKSSVTSESESRSAACSGGTNSASITTTASA